MKSTEIIQKAKHYFGKDRQAIKDLVLSYEFKGKDYRQWKKEIGKIIANPYDIKYNLFDDVILYIKDNQADQIDWNWIGDLSWTINIVLNPNIKKGYDWDKNLALKCNGTVRLLTLFISDVIPCYTYDCYYMSYSKKENYYEFGPIHQLSNDENEMLAKITTFLKNKGLQFIGKKLCEKEFGELYSDLNSEGNASLFDVLFTDTTFYTTKIKRFCDKDIIEKNGQKFRWTEYYNHDHTLKERIESRWTSCGDYFKILLDIKGQIKEIEITRREIEDKKHVSFKLNVAKEFENRKKRAKNH